MLAMFFFIRKKRELKHQGLPMILQETNFMNDLQEGTSDVEFKQQNGQSATSQRDSLVAQVRKRNSSYRSQLSSAASAGTVITYAEGMPYILRKYNYLKITSSKHSDSEYKYKNEHCPYFNLQPLPFQRLTALQHIPITELSDFH